MFTLSIPRGSGQEDGVGGAGGLWVGGGGGGSTAHSTVQQYGVITFKRLIHKYCLNILNDINPFFRCINWWKSEFDGGRQGVETAALFGQRNSYNRAISLRGSFEGRRDTRWVDVVSFYCVSFPSVRVEQEQVHMRSIQMGCAISSVWVFFFVFFPQVWGTTIANPLHRHRHRRHRRRDTLGRRRKTSFHIQLTTPRASHKELVAKFHELKYRSIHKPNIRNHRTV